MDSFDELFGPVTTNARAVGKFQPKGKLRPKRQAPLTVPSDTKEKMSEESTAASDTPNGATLAPFGVDGVKSTLIRCEELVSSGLKSEKPQSDDVVRDEGGVKSTAEIQNEVDTLFDVDCSVDEPSSSYIPSVIPDDVKEKPVLDTEEATQLSDVGKSEIEVETLQSVTDTFDDIFSEPVTTNAQAGHRFRPKIKPQPRVVATKGVSDMNKTHIAVDSVQSLQSNVIDGTIADNVNSALHDVNPSYNVSASEGESRAKDTLKSDIAVPDGDNEWNCSDGKALGESVDLFSGLDYLEDFVPQTADNPESEGSRAAAKVDINVQLGEKNSTLFGDDNDIRNAILSSEMETDTVEDFTAEAHCTFESSDFTICDVGAPQPSCNYNTANEIHASNGSSEVKGKWAVKFTPKPKRGKGKSKLDSSSLPSEEANYTENAVLGDVQSEEGNRNVDISTESNCLREEVENGESSRPPMKRSKQTVDEVHDTDDPTYEPEDDYEDFTVNNVKSRKRKAPRKGKEPAAGNDEPVQKRKYTKKASKELKSTEEPPKKFSHSSRRNKRRVDKALLEIPEDEIDPQRLPIRDLIILAEHRERMMIKDAAKLKMPQTNQSNDNPFDDGTSRNEDMSSEQGQYSDEDQATPIQATTMHFNYHTYMRKTPSTRWSKQETELFYEAVRQFGTDFSLIQQLFPNRTRHQVKLKFKKEERQHPVRLSEASMNRLKDHSHFESVIERLQQQAAAQKLELHENDPITGEEELGNTVDVRNDEAHEGDDEGVKEQEAEEVYVCKSPVKSDESDADLERWNNY